MNLSVRFMMNDSICESITLASAVNSSLVTSWVQITEQVLVPRAIPAMMSSGGPQVTRRSLPRALRPCFRSRALSSGNCALYDPVFTVPQALSLKDLESKQ